MACPRPHRGRLRKANGSHFQFYAFFFTSGSQSVVPEPATQASPRNQLEMQSRILAQTYRIRNSERVVSSNLCFNMPYTALKHSTNLRVTAVIPAGSQILCEIIKTFLEKRGWWYYLYHHQWYFHIFRLL